MIFTPLSPVGKTELSDCKRYLIAQLWGEPLWRAWRIPAHEGPNEEIGKHLTREEAVALCESDYEQVTP